MATNGIGLCARWRLEAQNYQTKMKQHRSTALEYSTEPPLAQNPCYAYVPTCLAECSFGNEIEIKIKKEAWD